MSAQEAVIRGAKRHLGPYAMSQGLIPTMCTNSRVLKSSIESVSVIQMGATSSSSKASQIEVRLWEGLIKGVQYLMGESDSQAFPA